MKSSDQEHNHTWNLVRFSNLHILRFHPDLPNWKAQKIARPRYLWLIKTQRRFWGLLNFKNTNLGKHILLLNEQSVYTYCFNDVKIGLGHKNGHDMMILLSQLLDSKIEGDFYCLLYMFLNYPDFLQWL